MERLEMPFSCVGVGIRNVHICKNLKVDAGGGLTIPIPIHNFI